MPNLIPGDLAIAGFVAQLPDGLDHVQHAACRRGLPAIDHSTARLDRQVAFEREVGLLKKIFVVSAAKTEIFDLDHHHRDVIII